ncbi:MAG: aldo/keto reductase, partial [Elusimicrobia bacterium]|nr:aldo/keto reductase [Elusimicrobiota bacterium]
PKSIEEITREHYQESCARLHVDRLDAYLIHSSRYAGNAIVLGAFFRALREIGHDLRYAGVSCYTPEEAFAALEYGCGAIQVPHDLLDLRAWHAGVFTEAERRGATVFARSPFCQGLLTLHPDDPRIPETVRPRVQAVFEAAQYANPQAAFALAGALLTADHVVFGCETLGQLEQNLETAMAPAARFNTVEGLKPRFLEFGGVSEPVVNPSRFAQP